MDYIDSKILELSTILFWMDYNRLLCHFIDTNRIMTIYSILIHGRSYAKDRMRENKNQPIKRKWTSPGTEFWYWANIKTAEICKSFKLSLTAPELEQIL